MYFGGGFGVSKRVDFRSEYPLAPEKLQIDKVKKLVPNLCDKKKYVLHYENLKLYLRLGLRLTKIHRGITFAEEDFMKKYIDLNTELRTKGTTDFEKDFFKLMNNSVFGKTMENVRNRINVKLVINEKACNKLAKKSNFKSGGTKQRYYSLIPTVFAMRFKQMISMKILKMMLPSGLIQAIMRKIIPYLARRTKSKLDL